MSKLKYFLSVILFCPLFFVFTLTNVYSDYQGETQSEAYEWIISNAENSEILESLENKWGDDYVVIKHLYQQQTEALEWINNQPNAQQILSEGRQEFGDDYTLIKYQYERELSADRAVAELVGTILISFFVLHLIFFLFFLRDMLTRKEKPLLWFILFIIFPPLGFVTYQSYKRMKKDEQRKGSIVHNLSKNFLIFWPIYIIVTFIYFFVVILFKDSLSGQNVDAEFVGEALFWFGGIFTCFILPIFIVIPLVLAALAMVLTKGKAQQ